MKKPCLILVTLIFLLMVGQVSALVGEQWHLANQTPGFTARIYPQLVVYDGKLWLMQGASRTFNPAAMTDVWNTEDGFIWHLVNATALDGRRVSHVVVFKGKMWRIGALDASFTVRMDTWNSTDGDMWYVANASIMPDRTQFGVAVYDDKIWVMGGSAQDVWNSDDGIVWNQVTSDWGIGALQSSNIQTVLPTLIFDNKLWVIGGTNATSNTPSFDAWYTTDGITWNKGGTHNFLYDESQLVTARVVCNAGTEILAHKGVIGVYASTNMDTWAVRNSIPQFNTLDYITLSDPSYLNTRAGLIEFNGSVWLIGGARAPVLNPNAALAALSAVWYTDNSTVPAPPVPYCEGSISTSSIMGSASAGIVLLVMGLIVIAGFTLISLLRGAGGES